MKEEERKRHTSIEDIIKFQEDFNLDSITFERLELSEIRSEFRMIIQKGKQPPPS